uniref:hypothetical protein n=1 Tax=Escherichia coli TaxID=562 RepID=UPI001BE4A20C
MEVGKLGKPHPLLNLAYVEYKTRSVASGIFFHQRKKAILTDGLSLDLMPGSSLLSHGETPHYHRRYGVSLL